ncbi:hypothetical protein HMPREF7215_1838 [Pyramidobacter piscolens W5455]|uniref:Uncharacterized protein n=1 Tax=Pyramidobacter piscolens W5455 TaxID=352165 RepID=A0ABP2HS06_9BACT|nr:hypothetical protein HMPREF7215_1838 [Pyramidobacter piscolens W5455]
MLPPWNDQYELHGEIPEIFFNYTHPRELRQISSERFRGRRLC